MASRNPADDPFWSVVADRHPDVDIVVLPPEAPPAPQQVGSDEFGRRREALARLTAEVAEALPHGVGVPAVEEVAGPVPGSTVLRARTRATSAEGASPIERWSTAWPGLARRSGPVETLDGSIEGFRLHATWARASGVLVLRIDSGAMEVVR